jgi:beta-glucosidase-like glycosyl hydrolase/CubicO group peptidase (beta-lactamase class C family)
MLLFSVVTIYTSYSQNTPNPLLASKPEAQKKWVDSVYNTLNLNEKIGQLYMIQIFSNQDAETHRKNVALIRDYNIGGIIYSKGGPVRQAKLNNNLQALSKIPLLVGMDAEWGLSMRLDSTFSFPWNMTLGAIKDPKLIEQTGRQLGEHCKRLGIHFNFAPVVDINTNPRNPIIGNRSFGEDRDNVTEKALAFMSGMQSVGVLANAKHFPGHGDTETDSHKTLPTVDFSEKRIDSIELYPYRKLISKGLSSVMVAHLNIPSLESRDGYPSSISENIVTGILKQKLRFKGLIFTDALGMKGVANFSSPGDIDLAAFLAGNDVMLMSEDVSTGISKIREAYQNGSINENRLAHSVKKVLMAKYKVGLHNYSPIGIHNLVEDLNRKKDANLYEELIENAITVAKDSFNILPFKKLENKQFAYVNLGDSDYKPFLEELNKYTKVTYEQDDNLDGLITKLKKYNTVIVGFHKSNDSPWKDHQFSNKELVWLYEISRTNNVILNIFTKPYALLDIATITNIEAIVVSYQNSAVAQQKSAQLLFGSIAAKGTLPVSVGNDLNVCSGKTYNAISRLGYTTPERVGMNSEILNRIDSIANHAVNAKMTPGIQLIVARKGKVVYNKNFGKHTYESDNKVQFNDVYDIASLTKITATLPLIMELDEKGIINLNTKLKDILPELKGSNKANITLRKMLSHYAKLKPWIPFYTATLDSVTKKPSSEYYSKTKTKQFSLKVDENLYMRKDYNDSIFGIIKDTDLLSRLRYRYSDLPYYILKKYIEKHYNKGLDELVQDHFYKSLGLNNTTYNPVGKIDDNRIIPTEIDDYFRFKEVKGYVHDMGAAMQGGVGGHAGIFSNANDMAKLMQMYLQKGYYGGKRYFSPETIDKYNTCYYCSADNRRGIGFDKPQLGESGPTCGCLSMKSFGHSGFTGTYAWADPEKEIVYIFLANRTYPNAGTNHLLRENIRTNIQEVIYNAIIE